MLNSDSNMGYLHNRTRSSHLLHVVRGFKYDLGVLYITEHGFTVLVLSSQQWLTLQLLWCKIKFSFTLFQCYSTPTLPSCELYSSLYLCVGRAGEVLMYSISSIRFEWDFYRSLCLLLWLKTSSSKRFLFSVTCFWYKFLHLPDCWLLSSAGEGYTLFEYSPWWRVEYTWTHKVYRSVPTVLSSNFFRNNTTL